MTHTKQPPEYPGRFTRKQFMHLLSRITAYAKGALQEYDIKDADGSLELPPDASDSQQKEYIASQIDTLKSQHAETSRILRRSIYLHLGFASYCLLALGTTDRSLLVANDSIKLPIISANVTFSGFLFLAPIVLVALTMYVQIYRKLIVNIESRAELFTQKYSPKSANVLSVHDKLPALFNLNTFAAKIITNFLLYWLMPIVLAAFYFKSLPRPEPEPTLLLSLTGVCTIWMIVIGMLRSKYPSLRTKVWLLSFLTLTITVFVILDITSRYTDLSAFYPGPLGRKLHLYNANLSGLDLRAYRFGGADLRQANLSGADLRAVDLQSANLTGANLEGALLRGANLDESILINTNLKKADLTDASVRRIKPMKANLRKAIVQDTDFSGSDMRRSNDIVEIQLEIACGNDLTKLPLEFEENFYLADCKDNPSRKDIRENFIHVKDSQFEQSGRYWSNREQILDIEESIVTSGESDHLLLYFNNPLNSVSASARKIAAIKDTLFVNKIYPIMFIASSGLSDEIRDAITNKKLEQREQLDEKERAPTELQDLKGSRTSQEMSYFKQVSMIRVGFSDLTDRIVESFIRKRSRILWENIKDSAKQMFRKGNPGYEIISIVAGANRHRNGKLKIHAISEGIGALFLNEMLTSARAQGVEFSSVTFIAPAITISSFEKNILPLLSPSGELNGVEKISIYVLPDNLEKDDNVGFIYRKSVLYLISNALERKKETPLLGMEKFRDNIPDHTNIDYIVSQQDEYRSASSHHSGFYNDVVTMNDILKNITGNQPAKLFEVRQLGEQRNQINGD